MTDDTPPETRPERRRSRTAAGRAAPPSGKNRAVSATVWSASLDLTDIFVAARRVLAESGLHVGEIQPEVDEKWQMSGISVDGGSLRFSGAAIDGALARLPRGFVHTARNPDNSIVYGGGGRVRLGPPLSASVLWSGADDRQPLTLATVRDAIAVVCGLGELAYGASTLALGSSTGTRAERLSLFANGDTRPLIAPLSGEFTVAELIGWLSSKPVAAADDDRPHCRLLGLIEVEQALEINPATVAAMAAIANAGEGLILTPVLLLGANAPYAAEGALVRFTAELLGLIAMAQSLRPGLPMVAGVMVAEVSMRSGLPLPATAEVQRVIAGARLICRAMGLPVFALGPVTSGKGFDGQSGAETALWLAAVADYDAAIGAIGAVELDAGVSLEKMVVDADVAAALTSALPDPGRNPDVGSLAGAAAAALIANGPGGLFLPAAETRAAVREKTMPRMADAWLYESWIAAGSPDATERAQVIVAELLMAADATNPGPPTTTPQAREVDAEVNWPKRQPLADLASSFYNRAMRDAFGFKG